MKKVVRDLKRGVNKKVLKVSGTEQKILDATSNEPWVPSGTHLSDIANATRNYHEYQIIMAVIWRRINDTGKNWRHVFKALQVLEYLVAHGSERVIDDIMEHGYQISSLAEFQYMDSSGRDQGINVRKKSQILVALVNDKEKIREVRLKAQSNKDKGAYGETGYSGTDYGDDGSYRSRTDERNGYNRDDERYERDAAYHDDNYRNRGNNNDNQFGSRSPSVDGYTDRYGDDDRLSSRSGGGRGDDRSPDDRGHGRNSDAHNVDAPPSYEEAIKNSQDTREDESAKENVADPKEELSENAGAGESAASQSNIVDAFDEFDPRGSVSAASPPAQPTASSEELDIFGFSALDSTNSLALVPANSTTSQPDTTTSAFGDDFLAGPSSAFPPSTQADENPFGDAPFKAIPQENIQATAFQSSGLMGGSQKAESYSSFDFGDTFGAPTFAPSTNVNHHQQQVSTLTPSFSSPEFLAESSSNDILDSILPRTGSAPMFASPDSQFEVSSTDSNTAQMNPFQSSDMTNTQSEQMNPFQISTNEMNPFQTFGFSAPVASHELQEPTKTNMQTSQMSSVPTTMNPYQMNSFHPSTHLSSQKLIPNNMQTAPVVPEASKGFPTNMPPSSQMNFFQASPSVSQEPIPNSSVPEAAKGLPTNNMQSSSQIDFFQSSSPSTSQEEITNTEGPPNTDQISQMSIFQRSMPSVEAISQEPLTNTQTTQMSLQESPSNIQSAQMNFFESSGLSAQAASQGLQSDNTQIAQVNNLQPPQISNIHQPPQMSNMQQQPQMINMQQPNQTQNMQWPPQTNNMQQPPQTNNMQQPPQMRNMQQPNQTHNMQWPPQTNNMQQPPQTNNIQQPPQMGNMQQPPQMGNLQQPPQMSNMQQPPQTSNMQTLQMSKMQTQPMQAPQMNNMQAPQMNYFHQRPQNNMPTSQMNLYQQSSGLNPNIQMGQMNYQPFAQGPQTHMQNAQPNFGRPTVAASHSQGMQAHMQTNQTNCMQPMSSSQAAQSVVSSNMQTPDVGAQANKQMAQSMLSDPFASQAARPQVPKGKFETKSTVWADTLSRGLVNLDISGPKTNPLAGIGVDFDAINRREKRLEPKSSAPPPTSTIVMGKAMGSGSGFGRSAASGIAPPANLMMANNMGMGGVGMGGGSGMGMGGPGMGMGMGGPGMGMGMGGPGMGMGMAMRGYGGNINQPPMGMNMGMMGQNAPMQPQNQGMHGGGGYNPMMGTRGYGSQHPSPYGGGGYR